jgi:hypothetical protein
MKYYSQLAAGIFAATIAASPAWAGSNIFNNPGGTTLLGGTVESSAGGADPFTIGVFSSGNECLRIAVNNQQNTGTGEASDLKATLVAPGGRVWQDDDSNGNLLPLIKAITPSGVVGWYTLALSQFNGHAVHTSFAVLISRFSATDSRCNPPTPPVLGSSATIRK